MTVFDETGVIFYNKISYTIIFAAIVLNGFSYMDIAVEKSGYL